MNPYTISVIGCLVLFVGMLLLSLLGHWIGRRTIQEDPDVKKLNTGVVDAGILSLLGLLIAFTFSSAYSRYEGRRTLIVEEANAIGTAYRRLDLLPIEAQPAIRSKFQDYVQSRIELWRLLSDPEAALAEYARSVELQNAIWSAAVEATRGETQGDARKLFLPALNKMFDITTTRLIAVQAHPPFLVFLLLSLLSLSAAWIVGYGMAKTSKPSYVHLVGFAILAALAIYVILDIEYLRYGMVTLDAPHQLLNQLQQEIR